MVYDPCNPVPGSNIPSGLPPARPQHAVHHVVGRIRHRIHHKYVHAGPAGGGAPNPYGCEKHAIGGPGAGRGGLPPTPYSPVPGTKLAALGAGGLAAGGIGGLVGGFGGGGSKNVISKVPFTPPGSNPVIPVVTPPASVTVPPIVPINPGSPGTGVSPPGNPTVPVPEPSSVVVFLMAVLVALGARYVLTRRTTAALPTA